MKWFFLLSLCFLLWLSWFTLTTVSLFTEDAKDKVMGDRKLPEAQGPEIFFFSGVADRIY